jgi:general secretion pathway protein B
VPAPGAPAASALPAWTATELPATLVPAPAVGTALATPAAGPASVAAPMPAAASATAAPAATAAALPAASTPEPLLRWSALPEATRASLPRLAWSGVVYAEQAAQRLLVVNGQVAREGDEIAPGLTLEQIRPRSAVLRWRGQRFEMPL